MQLIQDIILEYLTNKFNTIGQPRVHEGGFAEISVWPPQKGIQYRFYIWPDAIAIIKGAIDDTGKNRQEYEYSNPELFDIIDKIHQECTHEPATQTPPKT